MIYWGAYFRVFASGNKHTGKCLMNKPTIAASTLYRYYLLIFLLFTNIDSLVLVAYSAPEVFTQYPETKPKQIQIPEKSNSTPVANPKIKFSKIDDQDKQKLTTSIDDRAAEDRLIAEAKKRVSQNDLGSISTKFVNALRDKNRTRFYDLLDNDKIVIKSIKGAIQQLGDLELVRDKIIRGIINIPDTLLAKTGVRGHLKYIRLVKRKEGYRGLVRIKSDSGEISYLELIAQKDSEGVAKIVDFYDPMLARLYTTIVSQMLITPIDKKHAVDKILYFTNKQMTFQQRYTKTIRLYQKYKFSAALESFDLLPIKYKQTRDMLMLRIQIAKAANRNAYRESLLLLENSYSKDKDLEAIAGLIYILLSGIKVVAKIEPDQKRILSSVNTVLSLLD